jgi:putative transposase
MDLVALMPEHLAEAHPDVLCSLPATFVEVLMGAEVDALCNAGYRRPSPERTNQPNGYRQRPWSPRVGTIELGIPKLRQGTYFPDWLQERSRSLRGGPHQLLTTCSRARGLEAPARAAGVGAPGSRPR